MHATADKINNKGLSDKNYSDKQQMTNPNEFIFPESLPDAPLIRYGYIIGDINFLVPEKMVSELVQTPEVFPLPNSPSWIRGLLNIRGNIIPVMHLNKLLNISHSPKNNNILVFNKTDEYSALALIIDDLPVSLEQVEQKISTPHHINQHDALSDFIKGTFQVENKSWIEFNPQGLFKSLSGEYK